MSDGTKIEWTDATYNPITGCTRVSDGCTHCYIERTPPFRMAHRRFDGDGIGSSTGVLLHPERLTIPLHWRKPRRVFVCSLADLFHDDVPDEFIAHVFAVMQSCAAHTFQVLTKRPARMRSLLTSGEFWSAVTDFGHIVMAQKPSRQQLWPDHGQKQGFLPNVWLGTTAEDQRWADRRIPILCEIPAAVRYVSLEPLLSGIDLFGDAETPGPAIIRTGVQSRPAGPWGPAEYDYDDQVGIDWVITGGESGRGARPAHPQWFRSLRDQCADAGIAYLHKQNGEWVEDVTEYPANPACGIDEPYRVLNVPRDAKDRNRCALHLAGMTALQPDNPFNPFERGHLGWTAMRRVGKKAAGRVLDGRTFDDYPEAVTL